MPDKIDLPDSLAHRRADSAWAVALVVATATAFALGCASASDTLVGTSSNISAGTSVGTSVDTSVDTGSEAAVSISTGAASPNLGREPAPEVLTRVRIRVAPDGSNLPAGRGTAAEGKTLYVANCIRCHGLAGAGKPADRLVGGVGSLAEPRPIKTVGSYWPRATTIFDYVRRAMPYDRPGSLGNDEVYAITAYLLAENQIIDARTEMNATSLPRVEMPNRDGFVTELDRRGNE